MIRSSIVLLLVILSGTIKAQIYFQPYAGYMFSSHPSKNQSFEITNKGYSVYVLKYKMGQGLNPGIIAGYHLNDNLGIELNSCVHVFASFSNSIDQLDLRTVDYITLSGFFGEEDYNNRIFQIAPQFVYTISKNKFSVNLKTGPNFLKSKITQKLNYIDWEMEDWKLYPLKTIQESEYFSKFTLGIRSSVGIDYHFSSNLAACLSFVSVLNNCKMTHGEVTRYEIDGVSHMDQLPETTFDFDEGEDKINFSQVGLTLGVTYTFRKRD